MKTFIFPAAVIALVAASPASAQILGGGSIAGSLGGGIGGTIGGSLGGAMDRTAGSLDTATASTGSARAEKSVDRRKGSARIDGSADGSGSTATSGALGPLSGSANHSASGSANAGTEAGLIGTDAVRSTVHGLAGQARGAAGGVVARGGNAASGAGGSASGSAAGGGSAGFLGSAGQLVASGSAAASTAGMFSVAPGMAVEDARGRVIGHVASTAANARGQVQAVVVAVGDRLATLPAANFSGSGQVLVTAMSKGELKSAARDQEAEQAGPAE